MPESLLDINGVADRLGAQVRHVRRLVAEGRIPYLKWGHLLRFDPAEIDSWLEAARVPVRQEHVSYRPRSLGTSSAAGSGRAFRGSDVPV